MSQSEKELFQTNHVTLKKSGHVNFIFRVWWSWTWKYTNLLFYRIFPSRDFQKLRNIQLGKNKRKTGNKSERGINFDQSEKRRINHVFFEFVLITWPRENPNLIWLDYLKVKSSKFRFIRPVRIKMNQSECSIQFLTKLLKI